MSNVCPHCGATYHKETAKFCNQCGKKRDAPSATAAAPTPASPSELPPLRPPSAGAKPAVAKPATPPTPPAPSPQPAPPAPAPVPALQTTRRPSEVARATTPLSPVSTGSMPSTTTASTNSMKRMDLVRQLLADAELEHYLPNFESGRIDDACLKFLTDGDLEKIGVSLTAHRRKLLELAGQMFPAGANSSNQLQSHSSNLGGSGKSGASSSTNSAAAALMTLKPDGISPEMLETENRDDFVGWRQGPLLGKGSYGAVYIALLQSGRFLAVKKTEIGGAQGIKPAELVALSREVTMMRRLSHRNVCQFAGCMYEASDSSILLFMEYVSGGSLASIVKKFKPLPETLLQSYTIQLLHGLAYLHAQNCTHRDVKGENALLDLNPLRASAAVKLADFGAAKKLGDAASQNRTVVGTPYWMAPEVVLSTDGYSSRADLWSLGCTVCEMITGKPPWPSKTNLPAAILMIAQSADGPTEIPADQMSPLCLDFVKQCFNRDPEKRPDALALLKHPWLKDHPLHEEYADGEI